MTQNEVSIIKNSVIDATEAYVEARLSVLDFVKTQIGVVLSYTRKSDKKYYHRVRCNATSNTSGIVYDNVLSVGNIPLPSGSVVFLIAPNAQYSNQFILGKLDTTPAHIEAGSIRLGGNGDDPPLYKNSPIFLSGDQLSDGSYGHLSSFQILPDQLKFTGDNSAISFIKGTAFRISEFVTIGSSGYRVSLMMDGNNARFAVDTEGHPNGGVIVSDTYGWDNNGNFHDPTSGTYIWIKPSSIEFDIGDTDGTIGEGGLRFLQKNQDVLYNTRFFADGSKLQISTPYGTVSLPWGSYTPD